MTIFVEKALVIKFIPIDRKVTLGQMWRNIRGWRDGLSYDTSDFFASGHSTLPIFFLIIFRRAMLKKKKLTRVIFCIDVGGGGGRTLTYFQSTFPKGRVQCCSYLPVIVTYLDKLFDVIQGHMIMPIVWMLCTDMEFNAFKQWNQKCSKSEVIEQHNVGCIMRLGLIYLYLQIIYYIAYNRQFPFSMLYMGAQSFRTIWMFFYLGYLPRLCTCA